MLESGRYGGDFEGVEHGVWGMKHRGQQHRGKDLASTYALCPHQRTSLSSNLEETSRGDTRECIVRAENNRKEQGTKEKTK